MMHTEEEARKLWCPMARVRIVEYDGDPAYTKPVVYAQGENRGRREGNPLNGSQCIASQCMMWRWLDDEFEYLFSPPEQEGWAHAPYYSEGGTKCDRWGRKNQNRKGFCGIGGKP